MKPKSGRRRRRKEKQPNAEAGSRHRRCVSIHGPRASSSRTLLPNWRPSQTAAEREWKKWNGWTGNVLSKYGVEGRQVLFKFLLSPHSLVHLSRSFSLPFLAHSLLSADHSSLNLSWFHFGLRVCPHPCKYSCWHLGVPLHFANCL